MCILFSRILLIFTGVNYNTKISNGDHMCRTTILALAILALQYLKRKSKRKRKPSVPSSSSCSCVCVRVCVCMWTCISSRSKQKQLWRPSSPLPLLLAPPRPPSQLHARLPRTPPFRSPLRAPCVARLHRPTSLPLSSPTFATLWSPGAAHLYLLSCLLRVLVVSYYDMKWYLEVEVGPLIATSWPGILLPLLCSMAVLCHRRLSLSCVSRSQFRSSSLLAWWFSFFPRLWDSLVWVQRLGLELIFGNSESLHLKKLLLDRSNWALYLIIQLLTILSPWLRFCPCKATN